MIAKPSPLNDKLHASLRVKKTENFSHLSQEQLIPIVVQEFIDVASEFPIIFVKDANSGKFLAVAMMGIKAQENLYCSAGSWQANYTPLALLNYPFSLMQDGSNQQLLVCINENSPLVNEVEGDTLFEPDGQQSEYLKQKSKHLLDYMEKSQMTAGFVELLLKHQLLVPRNLSIKLDNNETFNANGIYVIDHTVLDALSEQSFQELRKVGALQAIYAQLSSMKQIHRLTRKKLSR